MKPSQRVSMRRKKFVKTPGGKTKEVFAKKISKKPICALCKKPLHGIGKGAKTKRRAERPYPNLCASCSRKKIIQDARKRFLSIQE